MIASSRKVKIAAAVLAISAHGAAVLAVMPPQEEAQMEGMSGGTDLALGSAFADMVTGTLSSAPTEETAEPVTPEEVTQEPVEPTPQEAPQTVTAEPPAEETPSVQPEPPEETTAALPVIPPLEAEPVVPVAPTEQAEPEELPDTLEALPPEAAETAEPEVVEAEPTEPETLEAEPETTETVEATEPDPENEQATEPETEVTQTAPESSMRPQPRRPDLAERRPEPAPGPAPQPERQRDPEPEPRRQAQQPQGNSDRSATAGAATGRVGGSSATAGSGGRSNEAGNAAASNYPGQVMRKLSRVPRPRINARGSAVIAFRVSGGGGLAGLSVARSSGSPALDQAALRVVRSASPFPAPPAGAQTSFTVQIKGR